MFVCLLWAKQALQRFSRAGRHIIGTARDETRLQSNLTLAERGKIYCCGAPNHRGNVNRSIGQLPKHAAILLVRLLQIYLYSFLTISFHHVMCVHKESTSYCGRPRQSCDDTVPRGNKTRPQPAVGAVMLIATPLQWASNGVTQTAEPAHRLPQY